MGSPAPRPGAGSRAGPVRRRRRRCPARRRAVRRTEGCARARPALTCRPPRSRLDHAISLEGDVMPSMTSHESFRIATLTTASGKASVHALVDDAGGMVMSTVARTLPPGILPVVALDRASAKPLYKQLYEGYRDAIVERRLSGGQRLPSTRSLAAELRISRSPCSALRAASGRGIFREPAGSGKFRCEIAARRPSEDHASARSRRPAPPGWRPGPRTSRAGRPKCS